VFVNMGKVGGMWRLAVMTQALSVQRSAFSQRKRRRAAGGRLGRQLFQAKKKNNCNSVQWSAISSSLRLMYPVFRQRSAIKSEPSAIQEAVSDQQSAGRGRGAGAAEAGPGCGGFSGRWYNVP
jgi:hypothetical protein